MAFVIAFVHGVVLKVLRVNAAVLEVIFVSSAVYAPVWKNYESSSRPLSFPQAVYTGAKQH